MGKLVRQCDMEVMKMAMLKHEETFRQQVHELHRLYRIQTQLMGATGRQQRRRTKQPRRALDLQLPADQYIVGAGAEDEDGCGTELELTLTVGGRRPCAAAARKSNGGGGEEANDYGGGFSSPFASAAAAVPESHSVRSRSRRGGHGEVLAVAAGAVPAVPQPEDDMNTDD